MKLERSNVHFPMWRKKVDSSLFNHKGTTIPLWVCEAWCLDNNFLHINSRKKSESNITVIFRNSVYKGWITATKRKSGSMVYRFWFSDELRDQIKETFIMSYMRDIEARLRNDKHLKLESEIPFWEFLDLEYDKLNKKLYLTAHYVQTPSFPELFKRLIDSPAIRQINDELMEKNESRIHKQVWKPRSELEYERGAYNVIYTLIDTKNKLLYVGEAQSLVKRFQKEHHLIPNWDYYRYNVLPDQLESFRLAIERMVIRDFASLFDNTQGINHFEVANYRLTNIKIDR